MSLRQVVARRGGRKCRARGGGGVMRGLSGSQAEPVNTTFWHFLISHWMMSPSVGLTFPVSYKIRLLNNIKAEFQPKVWTHKLFYCECLWIRYIFQIFNLNCYSVIQLYLSKIPIRTRQWQLRLIRLGDERLRAKSCMGAWVPKVSIHRPLSV